MANRNFHPGCRTLEMETRKIYGSGSIGLAGAGSSVIGTGVSAITKEGTGLYSITLEDPYNRFLSANAIVANAAMNVAKTAVTGTSELDTFTFVAKNACTAGDFAVITDTNGLKWAFSIDIAGTDPEPTAAEWAAVAAANKVHVDISGATTDANVATAVRAAFAGLSGIGTTLTVAASSGATIPVTHVYRAVVATPSLYKEDGTATPSSVSVAKTTPGIQTSIDLTANTIAFVAHGLTTGRDIALSIGGGTLPAGTSATTYYAIVIDANTIKLGSSLANAEAGTVVDITDYGTAAQTMTITPGAILGSKVGKIEFINSMQAQVAAAGKVYFNCYDYAGALINPTNGSILFIELTLRNSSVLAKGEYLCQ